MGRELLINETESFQEILQQVKKATESIYICMFIWRDDKIGNLLAEELIKAADRGVEVKICKDKSGAVFERVEQKKQSFFHKTNDLRLKIKEYLLSLIYYRNNNIKSQKQFENEKLVTMLNHENITIECEKTKDDHSKFFVFDEEILILGGINIGDKDGDQEYADYMVKFSDPKVVDYFWNRLAGTDGKFRLQEVDFYFNCQHEDRFEIKPQVLSFLQSANYRIDIEMAYFGDEDITEEIIAAAQRGVIVTIITSRQSNVQQNLNHRVLQEIIRRTNSQVKVYLSERMIHSKFMCIDRQNIFLGSANFHKLGMNKLSELSVLIEEAEDMCENWNQWRQKHLQECTLISDMDRLTYNKLAAITESVFC